MGRTKSDRIQDMTSLARTASEISATDPATADVLRQVLNKEKQLLANSSKGRRAKAKKKAKRRRKKVF